MINLNNLILNGGVFPGLIYCQSTFKDVQRKLDIQFDEYVPWPNWGDPKNNFTACAYNNSMEIVIDQGKFVRFKLKNLRKGNKTILKGFEGVSVMSKSFKKMLKHLSGKGFQCFIHKGEDWWTIRYEFLEFVFEAKSKKLFYISSGIPSKGWPSLRV